MNIAANQDRMARYFPDHIAIVEGEREVSNAEFRNDVNRIASALFRLGPGT